MNNPSTTEAKRNLDFFERKVVFRTARGYFLAIAVTAIMMFGAGALMGVSGMIRPMPNVPAKPALPAEIPTPKPITLAEVEALKNAQPEEDEIVEETPSFAGQNNPSTESKADPEKDRLKMVLDELKSLFPEPDYSWANKYESFCARKSPYGCLKRDKKLVQRGVIEILSESITKEEAGNQDLLLPLLEDLAQMLKAAPVADRGALIIPGLQAHRVSWNTYHHESLTRDFKVNTLLQEYDEALVSREQKVEEINTTKDADLMMGLYGILAGLAALVFVGVFLAHLAIERHLRELRVILTPQSPDHPPTV